MHELVNLGPAVLAYALSFLVIGRYWLGHHSFFAALRGFDKRLMTLNLLYLSLIVLVPFTTDVLDDYGDLPPGPILYAAVLAGASGVTWLMNRHSLTNGLVREEQVESVAQQAGPRGLVPALIFVASIPFALVYPSWTPVLWAVALVVSGRWGGRERA
jgi:uncharacterized membrane protein